MMFLVGQGQRVVAIGPTEQRHCPKCGAQTAFEPQLSYKFGQLDLLFGFVYDKRYQLACTQCNHGWLLDTRETERSLGRHPIPFRLRHGAWILAVMIAALAAGAMTLHRLP
ncbi:hypothetical protein [Stenotrophomonas sp.]|uniref:hypothetical protein n=1 Tax=Stenotrophomonas sp. TaxID=69392 RepID=UPI0028967122|nr:hypothetical protein [Stenotrophomonas sp.]